MSKTYISKMIKIAGNHKSVIQQILAKLRLSLASPLILRGSIFLWDTRHLILWGSIFICFAQHGRWLQRCASISMSVLLWYKMSALVVRISHVCWYIYIFILFWKLKGFVTHFFGFLTKVCCTNASLVRKVGDKLVRGSSTVFELGHRNKGRPRP